MVAVALTDVAGSSDVFERGFVTYSTPRRSRCWASGETLEAHGAVSEAVAREMAEGRWPVRADLAVSITGIADRAGRSSPEGRVCFGVARKGRETGSRRWSLAHGPGRRARGCDAARAGNAGRGDGVILTDSPGRSAGFRCWRRSPASCPHPSAPCARRASDARRLDRHQPQDHPSALLVIGDTDRSAVVPAVDGAGGFGQNATQGARNAFTTGSTEAKSVRCGCGALPALIGDIGVGGAMDDQRRHLALHADTEVSIVPETPATARTSSGFRAAKVSAGSRRSTCRSGRPCGRRCRSGRRRP
jgi:nicotinamide-nucleotide amidase